MRQLMIRVFLVTALLAVSPAVGHGTAADEVPAATQCPVGQYNRDGTCIPLGKATDAEVRTYLIQRSIAAYSGSCPCPYNKDRAGRNCGRRSAYSRPGGERPLCYPDDISDALVLRMKERYPGESPIASH